MRFISELHKDLQDPNPEVAKAAHEALRKHTFGFGYETDGAGKPIDKSATSDWAIKNGKAPPDRLSQSLVLCLKYEGRAAAKQLAGNIKKLDKDGRYADVIAPYLALATTAEPTAPSKIPIGTI